MVGMWPHHGSQGAWHEDYWGRRHWAVGGNAPAHLCSYPELISAAVVAGILQASAAERSSPPLAWHDALAPGTGLEGWCVVDAGIPVYLPCHCDVYPLTDGDSNVGVDPPVG